MEKPERQVILEVPFKDKDEAKRLGAWWDPDIKKWFVPKGVPVMQFKRWIPSDQTDSRS